MSETTPDPARRKKLKALARMMNGQNAIAIPVTPFLLDCFETVIQPDEVEFLLQLGPKPVTRSEAARIGGFSMDRFDEIFDGLLRKGLLKLKTEEDLPERYVLSSALVGWFAFQLFRGQETPEEKMFARRVDRLFKTWGRMNSFPLRHIQNFIIRTFYKPFQTVAPALPDRTGEGIEADPSGHDRTADIDPTDGVMELIEAYHQEGRIALMHCFCRQWRKLVGEPCRFHFPAETCIALGDMATQVKRYGLGRGIGMDEAVDMVQAVRKAGAIHTIYYENDDINRNPLTICNCCRDCCGLIGSYNRGVFPLHLKCRHVARVSDAAPCVSCLKCVSFCPTGAVRLNGKKPFLDRDRCIGCGQCVYQCPENRFSLEPLERNVFLPLLTQAEVRALEGISKLV